MMKAIPMTIDDPLLKPLDQDKDVRRDGRSAVIRRALFDDLRRERCEEISAAYARADAKTSLPHLKARKMKANGPNKPTRRELRVRT
jgi:predicted transcriptional regulator